MRARNAGGLIFKYTIYEAAQLNFQGFLVLDEGLIHLNLVLYHDRLTDVFDMRAQRGGV